MKAKKRAHERAVRTTITFPPRLIEAADTIRLVRGFGDLSSYLQDLARNDIDARNPHLLAAAR